MNKNGFGSLQEAREEIEASPRDYNQMQPHSALEFQVPLRTRDDAEAVLPAKKRAQSVR